eukprot:CAMPEP_0114626192 /NCGR_PEP_ID=MMETSP0168-20121206/11653_1 /TAXON_ID=95228 ORGANISM="Vannella sp., Strain DIVA3 517/6/12" /NCGR_SAMPLE_ID=MMETSP0168 /ASSEMBLY_ACC=CAM_ASM_000044 /LENGTH=74 /DNA_ID=CAMNT_0001837485 /DNA_START=246 /DNA_END=470 /DNA_ORIENTATION=-
MKNWLSVAVRVMTLVHSKYPGPMLPSKLCAHWSFEGAPCAATAFVPPRNLPTRGKPIPMRKVSAASTTASCALK